MRRSLFAVAPELYWRYAVLATMLLACAVLVFDAYVFWRYAAYLPTIDEPTVSLETIDTARLQKTLDALNKKNTRVTDTELPASLTTIFVP